MHFVYKIEYIYTERCMFKGDPNLLAQHQGIFQKIL